MVKKTVFVSLIFVVTIAGLVWDGCAKVAREADTAEKEKPVYGGTLTIASPTDPTAFDDAIQPHYACYTLQFTNEELLTGDWAKGRAGGHGTKECDWFAGGGLDRLEHKAGALAESWEIQGKDAIIFHLRRGVRWHNKPPTNGRELTADDVVFSLKRQITLPTGYVKRSYPKAAETTEIFALDPYTVVIRCKPEYFSEVFTHLADFACIYPKDALEQFGNMNDWKNNIGTGPFIFKEYVKGSHAYFERNPNYWGQNPVGPGKGDQLPYVDAVRWVIIPDQSTADALFRTSQIDILTCGWERAQEFLKDPRLKYVRYLDDYAQAVIYMRTDKEGSPFADKRVRQALWLAIDNKKILDEYYGGEGTLLKWPIMYFKEYAGAFVPLEQLPRNVQELYEYHPDKAKQLLAEAGYPNGFKAKIICWNVAGALDVLQMVKDMWAKVGVELEIEPKDYATFTAIQFRRAYDDMLYGWYAGIGSYLRAPNYTGPTMFNASYVDDPMLNAARDKMKMAYPDEAKVDRIHRELLPYLLEQAYVISLPAGYNYRFWWPWVKNYSGELSIGYYNTGNFVKYVWIDQELKRSILGR